MSENLPSVDVLEKVITHGDLASLSSQQRVDYYGTVCKTLGLNPYTKPFAYIRLNNKLSLYATKDCTDQLRRIYSVSASVSDPIFHEGVITVKASVWTMSHAREDESIGVVNVAGFKGEALANAIMKAETKAKRRATLSLCGLGWLDESQVEDMPDYDAMPLESDDSGNVWISEARHRGLRAVIGETAKNTDSEVTRVTEYCRNAVARARGCPAEDVHLNQITDDECNDLMQKLPALVKRLGESNERTR